MGYDISYHPVKEEEMEEWYFNIDFTRIAEGDFSEADALARKYNLEAFYLQKFKDTLHVAVNTMPDEVFDKSHGYYMAVIQGFYRAFFYARGAAFSFLAAEKPFFNAYTKGWNQIVKQNYDNQVHNRIVENYSSGVYIPADKVVALIDDYHNSDQVQKDLEDFFSHKRISVFLKALYYAKEHNCGLLEATEVIEPNPLNLNKSTCYSNLFHCDTEGPLLYQEAALAQLNEVEQTNNLVQGSMAQQADYVKKTGPVVTGKPKKSFWQKIFGK